MIFKKPISFDEKKWLIRYLQYLNIFMIVGNWYLGRSLEGTIQKELMIAFFFIHGAFELYWNDINHAGPMIRIQRKIEFQQKIRFLPMICAGIIGVWTLWRAGVILVGRF